MLFRKKRVELIEAFQYDGDFKGADGKYYVPDWAAKALENGLLQFEDGELMAYTLSSGSTPLPIHVGCYIFRNKYCGLGFAFAKEFEDIYEPVSEGQQ